MVEPSSPLDISDQDTVHLTIYRTDASADLILKLVDTSTSPFTEGRLDISAVDVPANQWVELAFENRIQRISGRSIDRPDCISE